MDSAVARAVASAPSPRVAAFLRRGGRHASEVAAAPERFCDAAQGVASAAKTCQESLARADEAYDAFVKSLSGSGGVCEIDAVPTGALLAALPLGDDRRTAEQWLWLLTAVLEALARETEVVRETYAATSRTTSVSLASASSTAVSSSAVRRSSPSGSAASNAPVGTASISQTPPLPESDFTNAS